MFSEGTLVGIDEFLQQQGYDMPPCTTMAKKLVFVEKEQGRHDFIQCAGFLFSDDLDLDS